MSEKSYEDMNFAKLDTGRELRQNVAEVVFCEGKEDEHLVQIFRRLYEQNGEVLGTRASAHQYELVKKEIPEVSYDETSRILKVQKEKELIEKHIGTKDYVITLEIEGNNISSEELARKIDKIYNTNSTITFIIGSSTGLHEDIKKKSNYKLSFSKLTFPHQLFRIILLEQIYRSFKINNNEIYHKLKTFMIFCIKKLNMYII